MFPDAWLGPAAICCCFHDDGYQRGLGVVDRYWEDLNLFYCLKAHGADRWSMPVFMAVRMCGWPIWWGRKLKRRFSHEGA